MDWDKVKVESEKIDWTEEMHAYLIELHKTGASQTKMAEKMSEHLKVTVTASAVSGQLRRLRQKGRIAYREKKSKVRTHTTPGRVHDRRAVIRANPLAPPARVRPRTFVENKALSQEARRNYSSASFDPTMECSITELNDDRCRWPLGSVADRPPYRYCGCRTLKPSPYCEGHLRVHVDPARGFRKSYYGEEG